MRSAKRTALDASQDLNDTVLVLWEYFTKAIGLLDNVFDRDSLDKLRANNLGIVKVYAHAEAASGLLPNSHLVTSDHLDSDSQAECLLDGLLGIVARRIDERNEANKLPFAVITLLLGDADRT
mmetsp:Transcript_13008/g.19435  ORF Transcript_13008/g.19435 Transcript_13008/m.19435 type:complete len:123 (-) Transcript_13008:540-908(-)